MKRGVKSIAILAVLTAFWTSGCLEVADVPVFWQVEEEDLVLEEQGLKSVKADTLRGEITISPMEEATCPKVRVVKKAGATSVEQAAICLDAIKIISKNDNGVQKIAWGGSPINRPGWKPSVSFQIQLPPGLALTATTKEGDVALSDMTSSCTLRTDNGSIKIRSHTSQLDAETKNGNISAECASAKIRLASANGIIWANLSTPRSINGKITAENGDIFLRFDEQASAQLICIAENGTVDAAGPFSPAPSAEEGGPKAGQAFEATVREAGRLEGKLRAGKGKLEVKATNGSITLK